MKAKQLLFICISLLLCTNSFAEEIIVELYNSHPKDVKPDRRSITLEPIAAIDGNTIHIYTDIAVSSVTVVVKDQCGNAVYYNGDGTSSQCHTFGMYDLQDGDYLLEFKIGDESYYGYFSIQQ